MSFLWVLNPDAETEIASPSDYTTPLPLRRQMESRRAQFEPLIQGDAACFVHELADGRARGKIALFWSPTPSARRAAERHGCRLLDAPGRDVLRRVLSREFLVHSSLPGPEGRAFVGDQAALDSYLERLGPGIAFRTKRAFGFAGRGHRSLRERLIKDDAKFLSDGLALGGLLIEPELTIAQEYSVHGVVLCHGEPLLGEPCRLRVDEYAQPLSIERGGVSEAKAQVLRDLAERAAQALQEGGYWGAFGADILEIADGESSRFFVSDSNARFTLGWSTGLGAQRSAALEALFRAAAPGAG